MWLLEITCKISVSNILHVVFRVRRIGIYVFFTHFYDFTRNLQEKSDGFYEFFDDK